MEDKLKMILMDLLDVKAEQIKPEASLINDLGMDSLDIIEGLMEIEEEFDVEITDEEAEKLKTVGDIHTYLKAEGK